MNYGELKAQIKQWSHRSDLDDQIPQFIDLVSQRLGQRFGVMPSPLVADTDKNSILAVHPNLYLYGAIREIGVYTQDIDMVNGFESLFQSQIKQMNINYAGLDWAACDGPVMRSQKQADCAAAQIEETDNVE